MWPVPPSYAVSTPYGKRGSYWSCDQDSAGNGIHTGADLACPNGTPLYAAIDGQIRHRNYGSAFGSHQFVISPDPGQPWASGEVFYAHARSRLADGVYVRAGDRVGESGDEGNVSGPHLHIELHPTTKNVWNCDIVADPMPALYWQPDDLTGGQEPPETITLPLGIEYHYTGKPSGTLTFTGSYKKLDVAPWAPQQDGLTLAMLYANVAGSGEFRVRLVRDPDDATAYQTFYPKGGDNCLVTHVWFESGEGGRTLWWEIQSMDGETMTVGTRYAKFATVPWDAVATITTAAGTVDTITAPLRALWRWINRFC